MLCARHRRALYKLQRQLLVVDLWPLTDLSERAGEKTKLLLAVHRLARLGLLAPPTPEDPEEPMDHFLRQRLSAISRLKRLTVEEFEDEAATEARGRRPPRNQQGGERHERPRDYFPSRYGYTPQQRSRLDQRLMREEAYEPNQQNWRHRRQRGEGEGASGEGRQAPHGGDARAERERYWRDRDAHQGA